MDTRTFVTKRAASVKLRRLAALAAAAFLAAQAAALAHEFDHALHKHNAPCALHLYADHLGKSPPAASGVSLPATVAEDRPPVAPDVCASRTPLSTLRARAPPAFSF